MLPLRTLPWLPALALAGCLGSNPAYDDDAGTSEAAPADPAPDPTVLEPPERPSQFVLGDSAYVVDPGPFQWPAARAQCAKRYGGDLVVIDDYEELDGLLLRLGLLGGDWWIGLSDIAVEGEYVWRDGTPLTIEYWQSGQPGDGTSDRDCVEMQNASALQWRDANCAEEGGAICEFPRP
jgi:hypothetical protein